MLDKSTYLEAIHREAGALAEAARGNLDAPVPSCPGWTVGVLVTHLTGIYAHRIKIVGSRATENTVRSYEDLDLPPEYKSLFDAEFDTDAAGQQPPAPPELVALFEQTAATLERTLEAATPGARAWTWWPPDQTAGFWMRRMAQETAVHRWDTQLARGHTEPIEPELARDGIDEVFDIMAPASRQRGGSFRQGAGESYHFHRTDGPGEWLLRFAGDDMVVTHEHAKADVAVRGTASDLLLFLWGRIPASQLEVFGDAALLDRYVELVPPD
jgi:uncharacterized protein (TIGR03083 family)